MSLDAEVQEDLEVSDALPEELDQEQEQEQEQEQDEAPKLSEAEERASNDGWMPKEDWVAKGRDVDDWTSAKSFNKNGELMGAITENRKKMEAQERDFNDRLASTKKLHDMQSKTMIAEFESKRNNAIEAGDVDGAVKAMDSINELNAANVPDASPVNTSSNDNQLILDFNRDNSWIDDGSPKAAYAHARFNKYHQGGQTVEDSIAAVKNDLKREYPETNPNRSRGNSSESGRSQPGRKAKARDLIWDDLTPDEKGYLGVFDSKKALIKAVQDDRGSK